jgi:hypothetical protein
MKNVTIDGIEYAPVEKDCEKLRIVVVDNRGLMFVGFCDLSGENENITIRNARCIIYWGTSQHIAEIVNEPTKDTRLGAPANVDVFRRNLICSYECGKGWEKHVK